MGLGLLFFLAFSRPAHAVLDGGIDPTNLGKGTWIYILSDAIDNLGVGNISSVTNNTSLMIYMKNQGLQYVIIKAAQGDTFNSQFTTAVVGAAHAAGLKIFGYIYTTGANVPGEVTVVGTMFQRGADGVVFDGEAEWKVLANKEAMAMQLFSGVRGNWPNKFLAHSPYGYYNYHTSFPYKEFGYYVNAVMPQDYFIEFGDTPTVSVSTMNSQYRTWQNSLVGSNSVVGGTNYYWTNSIKPLVPIGQGWTSTNGTITAPLITEFFTALKTVSNPATTGGYKGANFWRAELHPAGIWDAIRTNSIGNGYTNAPVIQTVPVATSGATNVSISWPTDQISDSVVEYGPSASYGDLETNSTLLWYHTVEISGLSPDTTYHYRVKSKGTNNLTGVSADYVFTTLAGSADDIIIDQDSVNNSGGSTITYTGTWVANTASSSAYLGDFRYATGFSPAGSSPTATAKFKPNIVVAGNYDIYSQWPISGVGGNRATNTPYRITYSGGTSTNRVNNEQNGGSFQLVATNKYFQAGTAGFVQIGNDITASAGGDIVIADAVKFVYVPPPPSAPSISTQPQTQSANQGNTATFTVVASGTATLNYHWRRNGAEISGATESSYIKNNAQSADAGSYSVVITNNVGSVTSSDAVLTVIVPPSITSQPQTQALYVGDNATFTVTASGTSPLHYQWQFNGADISAATTSSFTLSNAQLSDAGTYAVMITNLAASITSDDAILTVTEPLVITTQPQSQTVNQGNNAVFSIAATGITPLSYQWRFNAVAISGATNSSYTRTNTVSGDAGSYSVIVTNVSDSVTSSDAILSVRIPPSITTPPQTQSITETSNVTFTVVATGTATLAYQWRRNAVDISGATDSSYTRSSVVPADAGSYSVIITNLAGSATSANAILTVNSPPSIGAQPQSKSVIAGTNVTFTVTASGTAPLSYQWMYNAGAISGATASSYTRSNVQPADSGTYSVIVTNVAGSVTSSPATLVVSVPPSITIQPQSLTVNQNSNADFSVTASGTSPLSYQWRRNAINISGATASSYTRTNALATDAGSYSVIVTNVVGSVTSSSAVLSVNVPPSITTQPQGKSLHTGNNVTFTVASTGTSPLSYQWLLNSTQISGATATSYSLANVQPADVGTYSVVITNVAGSATSSDAQLTIDDPLITVQPQSQTVTNGTLTLSVTATGTGTFAYQWKKNGTAIVNATNNTYSANHLVRGNAGTYTVDVTGLATATSDDAVVTVNEPYIITQPRDTMGIIGTFTNLSVAAVGTPNLKYQWYFKGTAATSYAKQVSQTSASLTIASVQAAYAGSYFVTISNQYSPATYPGTSNVLVSAVVALAVNSAPTVSNPANLTKIRGNDAIFRVVATGTGPITYRWKTNGVELSNIPDKIIGADTAVLTIKDVQGTDVGVANLPNPSGVLPATVSYQCTVSNASLLTATSSGTLGKLTVTEDSLAPLALISHPITTYFGRLTNGLSKTTNFVTNPSGDEKTAPDVVLDGLAIDSGRIADISVTQKYYDTNGALVTLSPVPVTLYGSLPGLKKWTNNFVLRDGTNIFTAVATDSAGNVQTRLIPKTYFLVRTAPLTVTIVSGDGIGTGTTVPGLMPAAAFGFGQAANGANLEIGRGYQIKALPGQNCIVTNWTDGDDAVRVSSATYAPLTLTFLMQEGLELRANFMTNPIIAANVAGLYNGVFNEESGGLPAVTEETSGSMLNVTVRTNRLVIAPINIQGRAHTLIGFMDKNGNLTQTINRSFFGRSNLVVNLHLDWANNTKQMTGTISSTNSAAVPWSASFTNDLAGLYSLQDDRYTMAIPPTATSHLAVPGGTPGGYGYAMITNNAAGLMVFSGKTADGTAITQVAQVSKDGKAPIHINLYPVTDYPFAGLLHGSLDFSSGAPVGTLNWIKQTASVFPTNYPNGFTNVNVAVLGSLYNPNAYVGGRALNLTTGTFSVSDCNVGSDPSLTWAFGLSTANVITRTGGPATNSLSGSIVKTLGLMSVTFRPTGLPATGSRTVTGVVLQNATSGYGAFNGNTNQTGSGGLNHP